MTGSAAPFVPGRPEVVHPAADLEFVMLPATGRYVPSAHWRPIDVQVSGVEYRCKLVSPAGELAASVTGSGDDLPWVEPGPAHDAFATACASMPKIAACVPGAAAETIAQHLVAESILSRWCEQESAGALVWATIEGSHRGQWFVERGLTASIGEDVAVLCDSRSDAGWVWQGGTRLPARPDDPRLRHPGRVDPLPWPGALRMA